VQVLALVHAGAVGQRADVLQRHVGRLVVLGRQVVSGKRGK
jgi:hypothetical protein